MSKKLLSFFSLVLLSVLLGFLAWYPFKKVEIYATKSNFSQLPGWQSTDTKASFDAFQISCRTFLRQNPEKSVGSKYVHLQVKDWHPACVAAKNAHFHSQKDARQFFEQWFTPVEFRDAKPVRGLFTGYYMPALKGSLTKTETFNTPIYGLPKKMITANLGLFDPELKHHRKLVGRLKGDLLIPFYTREEINNGAIKEVAPVIAWVDSKVERQFLEIEGSGVIQLQDGTELYVGYAGENGAPYTPIARILIKMGVMTKDNASMQHIRSYLKEHPKQVTHILNQNKSFVFFTPLPHSAALGAQGVALTPGYSLAVDRKWVPLGTPIWLSTTRPDEKSSHQVAFQRLMIAQDTGGAIRGAVRGDVFWGAGDDATHIAGHMKNPGYYWLLLPKHVLVENPDLTA